MDGVAVRDGIGLGPLVDLGVDGEGGRIDLPRPLDHTAGGVHTDQVLDLDLVEGEPEGVHPEPVEVLGVPHGDVAGYPLGEPRLPNSRIAAASRCLRWRRSSSAEANTASSGMGRPVAVSARSFSVVTAVSLVVQAASAVRAAPDS